MYNYNYQRTLELCVLFYEDPGFESKEVEDCSRIIFYCLSYDITAKSYFKFTNIIR
jgi:hypothetical protein